jgi:hypothetical protein
MTQSQRTRVRDVAGVFAGIIAQSTGIRDQTAAMQIQNTSSALADAMNCCAGINGL